MVGGGEWSRRDAWPPDCALGELAGSLRCVPDSDVPDLTASGPTLRRRPFKLPTLGVGSSVVGEGFPRDDWRLNIVLGELSGTLGCDPDLDVPDPREAGPALSLRPYILPVRGAG